MKNISKGTYELYLNSTCVSKTIYKSGGGRVPDKYLYRYGKWLRRYDPIAFEVGYNDMLRDARHDEFKENFKRRYGT